MIQEDLFLAIPRDVRWFELGPDGALVPHTGDGRTITARRGQAATQDKNKDS
jgi:hypothetical protein